MKNRKSLCLLLVILFTAGFFAGAVAAAPSCSATDCSTLAMRVHPHHGRAAQLTANCCTGFRPTPCELGPRRVAPAVFCISSGRIHSHRSAVLSPIPDHFDFGLASLAIVRNAGAGTPGRSAPLYLENMTLIC